LFREDTSQTGQDLRMLILDGERRNVPVVQTAFDEGNGELSPDGKWLAYQSNASGQDEVYVQPFPDIEKGRWQISATGGGYPAWARDGRELFYIAADGRLMVVAVRTQGTFAAGTPRMIINGGFFVGSNARAYDVSPDANRFLLIEASPTGIQPDTVGLTVVLNWAEELKRLVPPTSR
jgi:serine/threonine-protein kinase